MSPSCSPTSWTARNCVTILGDSSWDGIRQQHFRVAVRLIQQSKGILIKNTGDGILALFHHATAAVGFAVTLHDDTSHAVVRETWSKNLRWTEFPDVPLKGA